MNAPLLIAVAIAAPVIGFAAYELFDLLTGQLGRPRWWRAWMCRIEGHDAGHPGDEPVSDRCLRCGGQVPRERKQHDPR